MFEHVVALYRAIGMPPFVEGERIPVCVRATPAIKAALEKYNELEGDFGNIDPIFSGGNVEFSFKTPNSERGAFFQDIEEFVANTSSLTLGKFRENFYIKSLDFLSSEAEIPESVKRIKNVVSFVLCLREFVAISIDEEQALTGRKLIFLKPSDGKSPQKAAVLKINLKSSLMDFEIPSFKILPALRYQALKQEKPQIEERILLMNAAIADVISECEDDDADFEYLVRNWARVTKKYLHNLHAYVSTFSFDATKKKISDGLIDSTTKINNAIGDIGTKLFAVPASIGALIIVKDSASSSSFIAGLAGIIIASFVIFRTIRHYESQTNNLLQSFNFNLQESIKPKKTFGKSIKEEIDRISEFKTNQEKEIRRTFHFYRLIASLPIVGVIYFIFERISPWVVERYNLLLYCDNNFPVLLSVFKKILQ